MKDNERRTNGLLIGSIMDASSSRFAGRGKHRTEFRGFLNQRLQPSGRNQSKMLHMLKPIHTFIAFFLTYLQFIQKIAGRFGTTGSPIVSPHRRSTTEKLSSINLRECIVTAQMVNEMTDPETELQCSFLHLVTPSRHKLLFVPCPSALVLYALALWRSMAST